MTHISEPVRGVVRLRQGALGGGIPLRARGVSSLTGETATTAGGHTAVSAGSWRRPMPLA
jgi:hypothetical protein